jgi:diaminohydroxyphosphoribosylaminopyrimidine deaminase/5-amino-6-(5-phosphoribosylamino)uracil reductase
LVAGKGIAQLRAAGIEVTTGVLAEELRWQNRIFLHYITHRRPWVVLKSAVTLDGKIATRTGDSRWVTGDEARRYVHRMRGNLAGIMVGIGTALADDPLLNCRLDTIGTPLSESLRQPTRWVVDSQARLPLASQLVQSARGQRTIIAHTAAAPAARLQALRDAGVETCLCDSDEAGHVAVPDLVRRIGEAGIDSLLLEGGGTLAEAFLRARCVQEVCCMIAPKLVGGRDAKTSVEGVGVARMADAITLHDLRVTTLGVDLMVQALVDAQ